MKKQNIMPDDENLQQYMQDISKFEPLSNEEEAKVAVAIRKGDTKAVDRLVKANLRFVVSVARTYEGQGIPLQDLIEIGNFGLVKAAYRFDEKKNFRFISYAVWWIRQAILQELARQSRLFKIPLNRASDVYKVGQTQQRLEQRLKRAPTPEEVGEEMGMRGEDVGLAYNIALPHTSLDRPPKQESRATLVELIEDKQFDAPDEGAGRNSLHEAIKGILKSLSPKERKVLMMYYGFGYDTPATLEDIGTRLNITRERVRQLKDQALQNLKNSTEKKQFEEFILE